MLQISEPEVNDWPRELLLFCWRHVCLFLWVNIIVDFVANWFYMLIFIGCLFLSVFFSTFHSCHLFYTHGSTSMQQTWAPDPTVGFLTLHVPSFMSSDPKLWLAFNEVEYNNGSEI